MSMSPKCKIRFENFLRINKNKNMNKSERLLRSERARKRRNNIKLIINQRTQNLYSHLHRLRIKKQKMRNKVIQ